MGVVDCPVAQNDARACPCGRSIAASKGRSRSLVFGDCCAPLLRGLKHAATAETLMRSRYTAYVLGDMAYLRHSWHPATCPNDLMPDIEIQWLGLKVQRYTPISATEAEVVFIAHYRHHGRIYRLQERSRFVREQGRWLYYEARP